MCGHSSAARKFGSLPLVFSVFLHSSPTPHASLSPLQPRRTSQKLTSQESQPSWGEGGGKKEGAPGTNGNRLGDSTIWTWIPLIWVCFCLSPFQFPTWASLFMHTLPLEDALRSSHLAAFRGFRERRWAEDRFLGSGREGGGRKGREMERDLGKAKLRWGSGGDAWCSLSYWYKCLSLCLCF